MRRASIVAPLILIAIGVLFLINNLRPDLPLLDLSARYWPFLLIAWGVLRLFEVLYWAVRAKPGLYSGLSGGEWVLIILIVVFGTGLYKTTHYFHDWPNGIIRMGGMDILGESYDFPIAEQKQACPANARIFLDNLRGNARIVSGAGSEVVVSGHKTVRSLQQADANQIDQRSPLEISAQGNQVFIRTNQEKAGGDRRISTDLDITIPKDASIQARGRYGDFDITGIGGEVQIVSDNAGVRLQDIGGAVRVDLRRSDIVRAVNLKSTLDLKGTGEDIELENILGQVTVNGSYSGDLQFRNLAKPLQFQSPDTELRAQSVPGQIRMGLGDLTGDNLVGPVWVKARSKDVQITGVSEAVNISVDRGDVNLRPAKTPLAKVDVRTRSGNIELAIPPAAKFDLRATTDRGDIENEFGNPLKLTSDHPGSMLSGSVGQGSDVRLSTDRGSITVRKATHADMTPVPAPLAAPATPETPAKPASRGKKIPRITVETQ